MTCLFLVLQQVNIKKASQPHKKKSCLESWRSCCSWLWHRADDLQFKQDEEAAKGNGKQKGNEKGNVEEGRLHHISMRFDKRRKD